MSFFFRIYTFEIDYTTIIVNLIVAQQSLQTMTQKAEKCLLAYTLH